MHELEPFYKWLHIYNPEEDEYSPFYNIERNEQEYTQTIYNYYISPYWDTFGSNTLYCKVLYADYEEQSAIIELVGEWNDAIDNDIMNLKREIIDILIKYGISKFVLICENVLNFHSNDDSYYEEWAEDIADESGFVIILNMPKHTKDEMLLSGLGQYMFFMDYENWRTHEPSPLINMLEDRLMKRISS